MYRLFIDYRWLNENTVDEHYPLSSLEEILDKLSGSKVFSTLDLKSWYHQVHMRPEDIEKTALMFGRGHYQFLLMPFGLKKSLLTFQRLMDKFLCGLGDEYYCQIYMDDLIVFSKLPNMHPAHLREVFQCVREFGLRLSCEKLCFCLTEIKFLGHIISEKGV